MEVFILVLIFGFLIYMISSFGSRFDRLEQKLNELNKKIDIQRKSENLAVNPQKPIEKTELSSIIEKNRAIENPVILSTPESIKPVIEEKPIPIKEEIKEPVIVSTKENIEEKTEKIVFSMDNNSDKANVPRPEPPRQQPKPYVPEKSFWEKFKEQNPDLEKFIGENIINKLGVLILVLGISYFVKYSIDKGWIGEPARVGIGVLCGAMVMGVAHKLRKKYAAFSSVFVAGAIAIFYFTIGIAFHDYHLFNQTTAFIIMVFITAFSYLISLSYDRKELAVLSLIGGFAVPFMVSTGEGNYVVLFTYITILNIGILALAYHKKWGLINILSYIFTVLLFGGWLMKDQSSAVPHHLGALIFAFVFYFTFILINIINNLRTKGQFSKIELTILASNTFLFYGAGMFILESYHPELKGLFTTFVALLNMTYAWFLYKKFGLDKNAVYLLIGQTLTFVTLAVPIQFEGHYITLFWAAEAVLLLWLSQKSKIVSYRFGSVIVHTLMLFSLLIDWQKIYTSQKVLDIVVNPAFVTGIFSVISIFTVRFLLKNETTNSTQFGITFYPTTYRKVIGVIGLILSYIVGILEVNYQAHDYLLSNNSANAFPAVYHLLFCAVFVYFINRNKTLFNQKLVSIISGINIILFAFLFSRIAFNEHYTYITNGIYCRIGFYLHYISLFLTIYFAYQLYKTNRENPVFTIFKNRFVIFIASFLIIYIASSETMLHGLVLSNSPVSNQDIQASIKNNYQYLEFYHSDINYLKSLLADDKIEFVKTQIIKTGFPVLWGILAFIFLILGIKRKIKDLRIIALILLGITILKLFIYDIRNVSETGKIIAFILLGILILIISFVYQKIKVLVSDEKKQNDNVPVKNDESEMDKNNENE